MKVNDYYCKFPSLGEEGFIECVRLLTKSQYRPMPIDDLDLRLGIAERGRGRGEGGHKNVDV